MTTEFIADSMTPCWYYSARISRHGIANIIGPLVAQTVFGCEPGHPHGILHYSSTAVDADRNVLTRDAMQLFGISVKIASFSITPETLS
jgi:hypothetical protein